MNDNPKVILKVKLFENDTLFPFNELSSQEKKSIEDTINNFIIDKKNYEGINLDGLNDENIKIPYGIIYNAKENLINKYLNKKTECNVPQYGFRSWGKVELLFELMDETEKLLCKEVFDEIIKYKIENEIEIENENFKNMDIKKNSKKKSKKISIPNDDNSSSISEITTISDISLAKECSVRKCSRCKLTGHNVTKCNQNSETKTIEIKTIRKCSNCKLSGHNINKCPSRIDITSNIVPDTDSEIETIISKSSNTLSEKEKKVRKCSKCSIPGHTIRKCPLNI